MRSGVGSAVAGRMGQKFFSVKVSGLSWLADHAFEIRFHRPGRFDFVPGQKIGILHDAIHRDYSLISSPKDRELAICVRLIPNGRFSPILAQAKTGDRFQITAAFGFFFYQPSRHPSILVATGTGVAPYVAFVRAGAKQYHLLHGVRSRADLYYRNLLISAAGKYTPCITAQENYEDRGHKVYHGRVTSFLEHVLNPGVYDFYLCGRGEMVRDATRIIDRQFAGSRVFSELFF